MGRKPKLCNCCVDCGIYGLRYPNYFMAKDELWKKIGVGRGGLCMKCFGRRLGRPFKKNDFTNCNVNKKNPFIEGLR